jgi:hypothetical protein
MKLYILHIWRGVVASLRGPYASERGRVKAARRLRAKSSDEDGFFRLNIGRGHRAEKVEVDSFAGYEMREK